MTINQLVELLRHIEEEHNFFNRKPGQRVVKFIRPHIDTRGVGMVIALDLQGYGWEHAFRKDDQDASSSMYNSIMAFLDTSGEESEISVFEAGTARQGEDQIRGTV